jgi:hypothetical protein
MDRQQAAIIIIILIITIIKKSIIIDFHTSRGLFVNAPQPSVQGGINIIKNIYNTKTKTIVLLLLLIVPSGFFFF